MRVPRGAVYLGFGLGAYLTRMEGALPSYAGGLSQPVSDSDRKLGANVGTGCQIALGRQLSLVLDVRYDIVSSTFLDTGGYLSGLRIGGGLLIHFENATSARTGEGPTPHDPFAP